MFSAATLLRRAGLHRGIVRRGVESLVSCAPNRALTCAVAAGAWAAVASVATHGDGARACFSRDVFGAEEGDALPRQTIDGVWIVRAIITDKSGESCFRVLHIPVASTRGTDPNSLGALSKLFSATGLQFRQTPGNYKYDWHRAPRRQFIVNLDAAVRVTASAPGAGSITLQPGEVFWVGDTTGKGHRSQAVNGKARRSLFITVPDDLDVEQWLQGDA